MNGVKLRFGVTPTFRLQGWECGQSACRRGRAVTGQEASRKENPTPRNPASVAVDGPLRWRRTGN